MLCEDTIKVCVNTVKVWLAQAWSVFLLSAEFGVFHTTYSLLPILVELLIYSEDDLRFLNFILFYLHTHKTA